MLHTGDLEHDLIEMPFVADARGVTTDPVRELVAEFACSLSHGFVADDDAAGGQQLLYHTQPEREPEIQPDRVADDLGGEPIAGIAGASSRRHPNRLLTLVRYRKRAGC